MKQTTLKRKTPLKAHKRLNPISDKQRVRNALWKEITDKKAEGLNYICEWCGLSGKRNDSFNPLDGHHIIKRRFNIDTYENCYICHRLCHNFIEVNNINTKEIINEKEYREKA